MSYLKRLIRRYPMQSFLLAYNTGIFAWLKVSGQMIVSKLGLSLGNPPIPSWLKALTDYNQVDLQSYFGHSAWFWLLGSMLAAVIWQFLKGVFKMILFIVIVILGIYLIYRNQSLLSQLPG